MVELIYILRLLQFGVLFTCRFTVRKVKRMGTAGDLSPVPFVAAVLGCCLWCLYGVLLGKKLIICKFITYLLITNLLLVSQLNSFVIYVTIYRRCHDSVHEFSWHYIEHVLRFRVLYVYAEKGKGYLNSKFQIPVCTLL
jgi:uncharacterized protein with PQ loop repeat